jgi:hypothetical protein
MFGQHFRYGTYNQAYLPIVVLELAVEKVDSILRDCHVAFISGKREATKRRGYKCVNFFSP